MYRASHSQTARQKKKTTPKHATKLSNKKPHRQSNDESLQLAGLHCICDEVQVLHGNAHAAGLNVHDKDDTPSREDPFLQGLLERRFIVEGQNLVKVLLYLRADKDIF